MNNADLEARLRDLPPELPDPHDRFGEIEGRVRRTRLRQRIGAAAAVVVVLAIAIPVGLLADDDGRDIDSGPVIATDPNSPSDTAAPAGLLPGADLNVPLSAPLITEGTGTTSIELGPRPDGATGVSTDLRCLSAGTFTWPSGASLTCNAEDAARALDAPESPGNVVDLRPGQTRIVIEADAGASLWISTTYVRTEPTEWAVTASGETYGVPNDRGQPDLIGTAASEGGEVRYARAEDLGGGDLPANPDEAMEWTRNGELYSVPTYRVDGRTIVGTFEISGREPGETATRLVVGSPPAGAEDGEVKGVLTLADGCLHLETPAGARWLILPWGVQLGEGVLETFMGEQVADLNTDVTFSGSEIAGQQVEGDCGTGLPPFYVTR
jgi:hypothetical protein